MITNHTSTTYITPVNTTHNSNKLPLGRRRQIYRQTSCGGLPWRILARNGRTVKVEMETGVEVGVEVEVEVGVEKEVARGTVTTTRHQVLVFILVLVLDPVHSLDHSLDPVLEQARFRDQLRVNSDHLQSILDDSIKGFHSFSPRTPITPERLFTGTNLVIVFII